MLNNAIPEEAVKDALVVLRRRDHGFGYEQSDEDDYSDDGSDDDSDDGADDRVDEDVAVSSSVQGPITKEDYIEWGALAGFPIKLDQVAAILSVASAFEKLI